jgi:hypothetical protein
MIAELIRRLTIAGASAEIIAVAVTVVRDDQRDASRSSRQQQRDAKSKAAIRSKRYRAKLKTKKRDARDVTQRDGAALTYLLPSVATSSEFQQKKEEIGEGRAVRKSRAQPKGVPMPNDWHPKPAHVELCRQQHVPLPEIEATFRDTTGAKGAVYADWDRGFNTYIRNYHKFNGSSSNGSGQQRPGPQKLANRAFELAEQIRQREFEAGFGRSDEPKRSR